MKNILIIIVFTYIISACNFNNTKDTLIVDEIDSVGVTLKMNNPIIQNKFTADAAAIVYKDEVYLYAGHDEEYTNHSFIL